MPRAPRKPARLRDIVRVRPRGGLPDLLGVRWWLLAPAISAAVLLVPFLWIRSQVVTLDDLRELGAGSRVHETPMLLWVTSGPDGAIVAGEPGGPPLPGDWSLATERFRGTVLHGVHRVAGDPTGARWLGWMAESRTVDGVVWHRMVRGAVPADLDRLGRDPELAGRWWVWARDDAWVDLRPDGTIVDPGGRGAGRWAGHGDVLVRYEEEAWRSLPLRVYVRGGCPLDHPDLAGWTGFGRSEECEWSVLVRRRE